MNLHKILRKVYKLINPVISHPPNIHTQKAVQITSDNSSNGYGVGRGIMPMKILVGHLNEPIAGTFSSGRVWEY